MIRKSIFESSETGRIVTDYSSLTLADINKRIKSYERTYGMTYQKYNRQFDCDHGLPWEMSDIMDWENLVQEKALRMKTPKEKVY